MYLMRFVVQFFRVDTTAQCVIIHGGVAAFGAILAALYVSSPITIGTVCAIIYIIPVVMDNTVRRAFAWGKGVAVRNVSVRAYDSTRESIEFYYLIIV